MSVAINPIPKEMVTIRPPRPEDRAFIYATWLRGLYYGNSWFTQIDKDSFMSSYHQILDRVFKKPTIQVQIACFSEDPELILGYAVSEPELLHWIFVKQAWRRLGIAKQLVPEGVKRVTHLTTIAEKLKPKDWLFDPFKL